MEKYGNSRNFHGTILSGSGKTGYNIRFDDLPAGKQEVFVKRRTIIDVVDPAEEEKEYDHVVEDMHTSPSKEKDKANSLPPMILCQQQFTNLNNDVVLDAATFDMKYEDENKDEKILNWEIVPVMDKVEWGDIDFELDVEWKKDIAIDEEDGNLADIFFDEFFPCIEGHGELIDDYHSNKNSPYHNTVQHDRI